MLGGTASDATVRSVVTALTQADNALTTFVSLLVTEGEDQAKKREDPAKPKVEPITQQCRP
jgi:hypothetical protein